MISLQPGCRECGCAISDNGPEQSDAWVKSMCVDCHAAEARALVELEAETQRQVDADAEYDARDADMTMAYEPRSAF